jgi:hypothetical protein
VNVDLDVTTLDERYALVATLLEFVDLNAPGWSPDYPVVVGASSRYYVSQLMRDARVRGTVIPQSVRDAEDHGNPRAAELFDRWWDRNVQVPDPMSMLGNAQRGAREVLEILVDGGVVEWRSDTEEKEQQGTYLSLPLKILGHTLRVSTDKFRLWDSVTNALFPDVTIIAMARLVRALPRSLIRRCAYAAAEPCRRVFVGVGQQKYCPEHGRLVRQEQRRQASMRWRTQHTARPSSKRTRR